MKSKTDSLPCRHAGNRPEIKIFVTSSEVEK